MVTDIRYGTLVRMGKPKQYHHPGKVKSLPTKKGLNGGEI
jgi:hypothetical protein